MNITSPAESISLMLLYLSRVTLIFSSDVYLSTPQLKFSAIFKFEGNVFSSGQCVKVATQDGKRIRRRALNSRWHLGPLAAGVAIYPYEYMLYIYLCASVLTTKYRIHIKAISGHTSGRRRHLSSKCATWVQAFGSFALNVSTSHIQSYICTYMYILAKKKKGSREYLTQISLRHATLMANFLFVSATDAAPLPFSFPPNTPCLFRTHPRDPGVPSLSFDVKVKRLSAWKCLSKYDAWVLIY